MINHRSCGQRMALLIKFDKYTLLQGAPKGRESLTTLRACGRSIREREKNPFCSLAADELHPATLPTLME